MSTLAECQAGLIALDVALLPPSQVTERAMVFSAALAQGRSHGLRLDSEHLPHVTLTQHFVQPEELPQAFARLDALFRTRTRIRMSVTGISTAGHDTVSMVIERAPELLELHEAVMDALHEFERPGGTATAFCDLDARSGDVSWVSGFRAKSSFSRYTPHITLGHGTDAPAVEPFTFEAATVAACHLGRFCTCRRILESWTLG